MDSKKINETVIYLHRLEHENEGIQTIEQLESGYLQNQNWNKFIKPGSVTIDIGAHSGDTLIPLIIAGSNNLKCKTKILAFEPNKVVFDTCKKNVDSNLSDLVDIKLFPFAIIDEDDKDVVFSDHGNNMCNGGIIHDGMNDHLKNMLTNTPNRKSFICKGYTLNTICNTHLTEEEINNISFIKIDTEGYDREIVISSKDFLMKYKPVIFMEWFNFYGEEDSNKLFQIIEDINYIPFNPITLEVANVKNKIWDLLLIHKDDTENLKKCGMVNNKYGNLIVPPELVVNCGTARKILSLGNIWELETIEFVIKNCNNKSIISAGSYIGDFIVPFSKNTTGRVFTFECCNNNYNYCKANVMVNNLKNVILSDYGLSNKDDIKYLVDIGECSKLEENKSHNNREIKIVTIDSYLHDNKINDEISIIQLDIEGEENLALEGAKNTIFKNLPIIISELRLNDFTYKELMKNGYILSGVFIGYRDDKSRTCMNHIYYIPNKHNLRFPDTHIDDGSILD